jgi:hypothetical protein
VLVKWNNLPKELSTWEDFEALKQEFPRATAWGQAVLQGRGNVSSSPPLYADDPVDHAEGEGAMGQPIATKRPKRANKRYTGKEWAVQASVYVNRASNDVFLRLRPWRERGTCFVMTNSNS